MKKIIVSGILLSLVFIMIVGCTGGNLGGTWKEDGGTDGVIFGKNNAFWSVWFNDDGEAVGAFPGSYLTRGNEISFDNGITYMAYKVSGNTLTLGGHNTFTRVSSAQSPPK